MDSTWGCQKYLRRGAQSSNKLLVSFEGQGCSIAGRGDRQALITQLSCRAVETVGFFEGLDSIGCSFQFARRDTPDLEVCGLYWSLACVPGEIAVALCHLSEYAQSVVLAAFDAV